MPFDRDANTGGVRQVADRTCKLSAPRTVALFRRPSLTSPSSPCRYDSAALLLCWALHATQGVKVARTWCRKEDGPSRSQVTEAGWKEGRMVPWRLGPRLVGTNERWVETWSATEADCGGGMFAHSMCPGWRAGPWQGCNRGGSEQSRVGAGRLGRRAPVTGKHGEFWSGGALERARARASSCDIGWGGLRRR